MPSNVFPLPTYASPPLPCLAWIAPHYMLAGMPPLVTTAATCPPHPRAFQGRSRDLEALGKFSPRPHGGRHYSRLKDTQSVNAKVEALSKERDERPKVVSLHETEGSFKDGNFSEGGRSSWSSIGERYERHERVEKPRREERRERHGRR
ncbi:hypothetical protein CR513_30870, partial [Mucuna pruriens]